MAKKKTVFNSKGLKEFVEPQTEKELQTKIISYYKNVIKTFAPKSRLIVDPFCSMLFDRNRYYTQERKGRVVTLEQQLMQKAKAQGFEPAKSDIIIIYRHPRGAKSPITGETFCGLALELKKFGTKVYREDGKLYKSDHLSAQKMFLDDMNEQGFYSCFSIGEKQTKRILNKYFFGGKK